MSAVRRMTPLLHLLIVCSILSGAGCEGDKEKKKERFLARGEEYFQQGHYPEAMIQFKNVIQLDPRSAIGYYRLGLTCAKLGRAADTFMAFRKSVEADPDFPSAQIQLGNLYLLSKRPEEAKQCAEHALATDPGNWKAWILLANASIMRKKFPEAGSALQKATEAAPDEILPRLLTAKLHEITGNVEEAESTYLNLARRFPSSLRVEQEILHFYRKTGQQDKLLKRASDNLEQTPVDPVRMEMLAEVCLETGLTGKAVSALERALSADPQRGQMRMQLGMLYLKQGQRDRAKAEFEKAVDLSQENSLAKITLADLLLSEGSLEEAEPLVHQLLEQNPEEARVLSLQGRVHLLKEDYNAAIEAFQKAISKNDSPSISMLIGMLYETMGRDQKAAEHYAKALELKPDFGPAANNLAWYYSEEGNDLGRALLLAEKARERLPENPFVADTCGWIYEKKGLHYEARALLEESRAALPDHPTVHYHLGVTYHSLGETEKARASLEEALRLNPGFSEAEKARELLQEITSDTG